MLENNVIVLLISKSFYQLHVGIFMIFLTLQFLLRWIKNRISPSCMFF